MDMKQVLLLSFIIFLIKSPLYLQIFSGSNVTILANKSAIKNQITQNRQLAEELHKPVIR